MRQQPRLSAKKANQESSGKSRSKTAISPMMSVGGAGHELAGWLTKEEAAERLQTSVRSIERRIAAGEIEAKKRRKSGPKQSYETVVNPRDIEKLMPAAHVVPTTRPPLATGSPQAEFAVNSTNFYDFFQALLATLATGATTPRQAAASKKLWLTLEEAEAHSGLSVALLKQLCKAGKLGALRDGREWKIQRNRLDEFKGE